MNEKAETTDTRQRIAVTGETSPRSEFEDRLDAQYAGLMEIVWACECAARREDRIDAALRYAGLR